MSWTDDETSSDFDEALPLAVGRYLLVERLAQGGMGAVYTALQRTRVAGAERFCVVKVVKPRFQENKKALERFLHEAKTSLLLSHKNICTTIDVDEHQGIIVLAMENIAGHDVRTLFERQQALGRPLEPAAVAAIGLGALAALEHAHDSEDPRTGKALHLVHRDISPHNLMVSFDGDLKVIDFGIARSRLRPERTVVGTVVGKLRYMAPEQAQLDAPLTAIDGRADTYCLAIVLCELFSGQRFYGQTRTETISLLLQGTVPFRSPALDAVPARVRPVLERALQREPDQRHPNAAAFRVALEDAYGAPPVHVLRDLMRTLFPGDEQRARERLKRLYQLARATPDDDGDSDLSEAPTLKRSGEAVARAVGTARTDDSTLVLARLPGAPASVTPRVDDTAKAPAAKDSSTDSVDPPSFLLPPQLLAAPPPAAPSARPTPPMRKARPSDVSPAFAPAPDGVPQRRRGVAVAGVVVAALVVVAAWALRAPRAAVDAAADAGVVAAAPVDAGAGVAAPVDVVAAPDAGAVAAVDAGAEPPREVVKVLDEPPALDAVDAGAAPDPSAERPKRPRPPPRPLALPPRPSLLGERARYLQVHCARLPCTKENAQATQGGLANLSVDEIRAFAAQTDRCLDRCGAP